MIRLAVVIFAIVGASYLLPKIFTHLGNTAFTLAGYGVTWTIVVSVVVGYAAWKITK